MMMMLIRAKEKQTRRQVYVERGASKKDLLEVLDSNFGVENINAFNYSFNDPIAAISATTNNSAIKQPDGTLIYTYGFNSLSIKILPQKFFVEDSGSEARAAQTQYIISPYLLTTNALTLSDPTSSSSSSSLQEEYCVCGDSFTLIHYKLSDGLAINNNFVYFTELTDAGESLIVGNGKNYRIVFSKLDLSTKVSTQINPNSLAIPNKESAGANSISLYSNPLFSSNLFFGYGNSLSSLKPIYNANSRAVFSPIAKISSLEPRYLLSQYSLPYV